MENDIFAELACGIYLIGDDGEITMYPDRNAARQAAVNCSADGIGCSIVNIEERYSAMPQPDDNAGIYRPTTLHPPLDGRRAA